MKSTYDERSYLVTLQHCLIGLKESAEILEVKSRSISRKGNGLEWTSWTAIEEAIRNTFGGGRIIINVCTNEIKVRSINDRYKIIEECHSSTTGGNLGIAKTYHRIRDRFYWEGIKLDVQDFVRSCESCRKTKLTRRKEKEPMKITDTPRKVFEKIQIDIVGPLPIKELGNKYILTVQDCLTKYSDAMHHENILPNFQN